MSRVETACGSFEAPDGWTILEGLGATDGVPDMRPEAREFLRSLVLTGDDVPEGVTGEAYMERQEAMLAGTLPRFTKLDAHVPSPVGQGPCVLRYYLLPPDAEAWLMQFQAYWFHGASASILTLTARADDSESSWAVFTQAMGTFTPPEPSSAAA